MGVESSDGKPIEISEDRIRAALKASRGAVSVAAETLGISRPTLYKLMRRYGIEVRRVIA